MELHIDTASTSTTPLLPQCLPPTIQRSSQFRVDGCVVNCTYAGFEAQHLDCAPPQCPRIPFEKQPLDGTFNDRWLARW